MASLKETRITDLKIQVGVDDLDRTSLTVTVYANTRTNEGQIVSGHVADRTDLVTPEKLAIMVPLIQEVIEGVMTDRQITEADLDEAEQWDVDNPPAQLPSLLRDPEPDIPATVSPAVDPDKVPPDISEEEAQEITRRHYEDVKQLHAEMEREAEEAAGKVRNDG